ncbi:MAG: SurA N-terminal domain-containing protein, partial [Gemmatimonadales bacterium]
MVMRQMRGMAKWIMLVVAVSFVGWMVFQVGMDVTGQGSGGAASDTALRINGVKIDYQSFLAAVRNASERERNQTGSAPITLDDQRRLV